MIQTGARAKTVMGVTTPGTDTWIKDTKTVCVYWFEREGWTNVYMESTHEKKCVYEDCKTIKDDSGGIKHGANNAFFFWCWTKVSCEKFKGDTLDCVSTVCRCPFQLKAQVPSDEWDKNVNYDQSTSPKGIKGVEDKMDGVVEGMIDHEFGDPVPKGMQYFRWRDCKKSNTGRNPVDVECPGTGGVT